MAASVLLVFGLFAAVWSLKPVATNSVAPSDVAEEQPQSKGTETAAIPGSTEVVPPSSGNPYTFDVTNFPDKEVVKLAKTANFKPASEQVKAQPAVLKTPVERVSTEEYLPGEESYMRTIADLKQNVDGQKDRIMNPSSRISYERDMAVVNDAIKKMKEVVKKNPKNQSAKQVLYSSYQNKIDLLNSVVEREELMASLRY